MVCFSFRIEKNTHKERDTGTYEWTNDSANGANDPYSHFKLEDLLLKTLASSLNSTLALFRVPCELCSAKPTRITGEWNPQSTFKFNIPQSQWKEMFFFIPNPWNFIWTGRRKRTMEEKTIANVAIWNAHITYNTP